MDPSRSAEFKETQENAAKKFFEESDWSCCGSMESEVGSDPHFCCHAWPAADSSPEYQLNAKGIGVELSAKGEIVGVKAGGRKINLVGRTSLAGCTQAGAAKEEKLSNGAIQFTRTLKDSASGRSLTAVDRFSPAGDSVRWEIEIVSDGNPWTTDIVTELQYPATAATRFWTAWADPVWSTSYRTQKSRPANGAIRSCCSR